MSIRAAEGLNACAGPRETDACRRERKRLAE
jgi:hypothetical protein